MAVSQPRTDSRTKTSAVADSNNTTNTINRINDSSLNTTVYFNSSDVAKEAIKAGATSPGMTSSFANWSPTMLAGAGLILIGGIWIIKQK
jgi:hypothetical protein